MSRGLLYVFNKTYRGNRIMNWQWAKVFASAACEVFWVIGLKHADTWYEWAGTGLLIIISFYVMITASKTLPVGTVYAVFTGLGTAGTVIADFVFFGEPLRWSTVLLISTLLIGVIGLKLTTDKQAAESAEGGNS